MHCGFNDWWELPPVSAIDNLLAQPWWQAICLPSGLYKETVKESRQQGHVYSITRVASWGPDRRKWLFSEVRGGIWTSHSPVLIKISADKRPLNQLTVKNLFFSLFIKTFCLWHNHIVHEKTINLSVWMKEICTLLVKLHTIFSRMQRVNQHARPSIIQVECPTCCYQVCALDHTNVGTADLD